VRNIPDPQYVCIVAESIKRILNIVSDTKMKGVLCDKWTLGNYGSRYWILKLRREHLICCTKTRVIGSLTSKTWELSKVVICARR
jgi:hypothetical protein